MGTVLKAVSFFYSCTFLATAPWEGMDYGAPAGTEVLESVCTNILLTGERALRFSCGHERLDFLSYDAKENIFRCYEIKVTMEDLRSDAKLSWCGHYNYLVISKVLYLQKPLDWWKKQVPDFVGIIVAYPEEETKKAIKKAKKIEIDKGQEEMLKRSLIRSLFYKKVHML